MIAKEQMLESLIAHWRIPRRDEGLSVRLERKACAEQLSELINGESWPKDTKLEQIAEAAEELVLRSDAVKKLLHG